MHNTKKKKREDTLFLDNLKIVTLILPFDMKSSLVNWSLGSKERKVEVSQNCNSILCNLTSKFCDLFFKKWKKKSMKRNYSTKL